MTTEIVLKSSTDGDLILSESDVKDFEARKTHTGIGVFRATLATTKDPIPYAQRKDRFNLNIDGSTEFTGKLVIPNRDTGTGIQRIKGFGIGKILEASRPDYENLTDQQVTYSSIVLEDAIADYWTRTPFDNVTVVDEPTEIVEQDATLADISTQSEWESKVSPADTDPYAIRNDGLEVEQTGFVAEGESSTGDTESDVEYSDGSAGRIFGTGSGDITLNFSTEYKIPSGSGEFYIRGLQGDSSGTSTTVSVFLDGSKVLNDTIIVPDTLGWKSVFTTPSDLAAGSHTVRISLENANDNIKQVFDVLAFVDNRYTYNFDNSVHQDNGYLDGPEKSPSAVRVDSGTEQTKFNIAEAAVDATVNDTTGGQAIGIDLPLDTATDFFANTSSATLNNPDVAREVGVEFKLGHYPQSTNAQSATPRYGYNRQRIDSFTLTADLDSLTVIDEIELRGNHFQNLKQLHEYGNFLWTIEHDSDGISNLVVYSYAEGSETRSRPNAYDEPLSKQSSVDATNYFNAIFFRGAVPASGTQPTATAEDTDEINDANERLEATVKDPKVKTEAGADFRAQSLLDKLTDENKRRGELEIPLAASITHPGYARPVDFGNGQEDKTIEEVRLTSSATDGVTQTHNFSPPDQVSRELDQLKRNARDTRDQV
jgi:hypothetical protein